MVEYWIDFSGSVKVTAANSDDAETKARELLDNYWDETNPVSFMQIDNVERVCDK